MAKLSDEFDDKRRGIMLIISAPSGTGKSSVIKRIMSADENIRFSVSVTTRKPRDGEKNGVDYYFISDEQYNKYREENAFYECVDSDYGSRYGTLRSEVDQYITIGQDVVFDVDYYGLQKMKKNAPDDVVSIFMLPPSLKEVKQRLINRGTDSMEIINKRMSVVLQTLEHWKEYDYVLVNEELDETVKNIQKIISAERIKRIHQPNVENFINNLVEEARNDK